MRIPATYLVIAPFWGNQYHVGVHRVNRFIRWLQQLGHNVIIVDAGTADTVQKHEWGIEITVKDPLKFPSTFGATRVHKKKFQMVRTIWKSISNHLFIPDQSIVWALKIINHRVVRMHLTSVDAVISSSPPESTHISSYLISKKYSLPHIIDMRDGWLDEPLRPVIQHAGLRTFIEGKLEKKILHCATHIFVTAAKWKENLIRRYPKVDNKITVLTNGYPRGNEHLFPPLIKHSDATHITLLHTGQFSQSKISRNVGTLLEPIFNTVQSLSSHISGEVKLLGNMEQRDLDEIEEWKPRFSAAGWDIIHIPRIPREQVLQTQADADGLLLLSNSIAPIPSKLFEYIPAAKPILAITTTGSSVWELCKNIPQVYLYDCTPHRQHNNTVVQKYINACRTGDYQFSIPKEFSDEYLSDIFKTSLNTSTSS